MENYKFIGFQESRRKNKKYDAILRNEKTLKYKYVPFGDKRYEQYKDNTGLNIYSHLDHNDKMRRKNYRKRHYKTHFKKFSPSYFSWHYLW